jgi:hypothetical protein
MPVTAEVPHGNGRTADAALIHVQVGPARVDVDVDISVATSNAASGANGERALDHASEPPGGGTTLGGGFGCERGVSLRKTYKTGVGRLGTGGAAIIVAREYRAGSSGC